MNADASKDLMIVRSQDAFVWSQLCVFVSQPPLTNPMKPRLWDRWVCPIDRLTFELHTFHRTGNEIDNGMGSKAGQHENHLHPSAAEARLRSHRLGCLHRCRRNPRFGWRPRPPRRSRRTHTDPEIESHRRSASPSFANEFVQPYLFQARISS